jgi:mycofactocin precursor
MAGPSPLEVPMLEPTAVSTATASTATDTDVEDLIEDVSIDGMCGVY